MYVSYVNLSLGQQTVLGKSANFCGPVLCSSCLMPECISGKWEEHLVYVSVHKKKENNHRSRIHYEGLCSISFLDYGSTKYYRSNT